jgi:hypothetical protein
MVMADNKLKLQLINCQKNNAKFKSFVVRLIVFN